MQNIHKKVVKRLFLGWLLLSLIIGGAVLYLKIGQVDQQTLELAMRESQHFTVEFDRSSSSQIERLKQKADQFLKGHFMILELYDEHKKQILRRLCPGGAAIVQKLDQHTHAFPMENTAYHRNFLLDQKLFMQVLLPLQDKSGELIGYFEGVYQVDAETLRNIRTDIVRTLLMVVTVILITAIMLYPIIISLNRGLIQLTSDLLKGNIELMDVLGSAIAKRDSDTNSHNYRVTIYAIRLAEVLGLPSAQIRHLIAGAFLHDVGKIGIRDNILLKPAKLSDEEFAVMRDHVLLGVDIISKSKWLAGAREVVEFHHEKFDGSGYMQGLKGKEIPLNARIFAIVDVFDALTSKRPYKESFGFQEAMNILQRGSGSHFDPDLLRTFSGIVASLYQETAQASDSSLAALLNQLVNKHFFHA
jgi:HD-GYP domain-containing protein (c-di-GMP phosphodiesterase class II)